MSNRLLRGVAALAIALGALAFPSAEPSRAASAECTGWTSSLVPPTSIRVYRTSARRTVTVPFRAYVETVMASEWGRTAPMPRCESAPSPSSSMGWYFAMVWRGGSDPQDAATTLWTRRGTSCTAGTARSCPSHLARSRRRGG